MLAFITAGIETGILYFYMLGIITMGDLKTPAASYFSVRFITQFAAGWVVLFLDITSQGAEPSTGALLVFDALAFGPPFILLPIIIFLRTSATVWQTAWVWILFLATVAAVNIFLTSMIEAALA